MSNFNADTSSDLEFNSQEIREIASKKLLNDSENVEITIAWHRKIWNSRARTQIAVSKEHDVPMRLIPVGSRIKIGDQGGVSGSGIVGTPKINSLGETIGRYRNRDGDWIYISGNTLMSTVTVDPNKSLSPRWKKENAIAGRLQNDRAKHAGQK